MSWSAHLQHTETGLAIVFAGPVSRLDMDPATAAHLASLLAIEARHRMLGVVAVLNTERLENKQLYVEQSLAHPLCCDCDPCLNGDDHDQG